MARGTITLLYFAGLKDLLGRGEERLALEDGVTTVQALSAHLRLRHIELEGRLDNVRFAINECFVDRNAPISDGDVIALIPPVAGG